MHTFTKSFDWSHLVDELEALFKSAGLVALSKAVRKGTATCPEIERVLLELLVYRRVPYLPFLPVAQLDLDLFHTGTITPDAAKPALREFIDALPSDVVFHHVVSHPGPVDVVPGLIAGVVTESVIGQLCGYFTLVPVPRFVDATHLLNSDTP